jgi:hypothetical protein
MKNKVYKVLSLLIAVLMLSFIAGCSGGKGESSGANPSDTGAAAVSPELKSGEPEEVIGGIPRPDLGAVGSETYCDIPFGEGTIFPDKETAYIYRVVVDDIDTMIGQASIVLDEDIKNAEKVMDTPLRDAYKVENGFVTFDKATGFWNYTKKSDPDAPYPTMEETNKTPTEEEATEIAEKLLGKTSLFPGDLGEPLFSDASFGGWGDEEQVYAKYVWYYPQIDGYNVYGIHRISIGINYNREIERFGKQVNNFEKGMEVRLKTRDEVAENLKSGECVSTIEANPKEIDVIGCALVYYADAMPSDAGETYIYPVYLIKGSYKNLSGEAEDFNIYVDAIAEKN